ncbi:MAG: type III-B CRISPR-associated protein Cas10/Cmr2 [Deltaproteobacteria bacterium]|nr:MAG: type III-B CRISPR-associated protein Cas10/Cmr2 [Deltaproteobacteria bacterium]
MTQHLLAMSLGPVQGFIAAARKGSDLWAGSQLLREVTSAAAIAALDAGAELVMPSGDKAALARSDHPVSNKVLAVVSGDPEALARAMEGAARDELGKRTEAALKAVPRDGVDLDLARAQVRELLEVSWAAVPLGPGDDAFRAAAAAVEHLLAATKTARAFAPAPDRPGRPKSSLDPALESVIKDDRRYARGRENRAAMYRRLKVRPGERLSGVDLVKRFWGSDDIARVPSTSHVASYSLRRAWLHGDGDMPALREAWDRFLATLRPFVGKMRPGPQYNDPVMRECDGHLLYPGRLVDLGLEGDPLRTCEEAQHRLLGDWKRILGDRFHPLSPYYALLMGDGDRIGAALAALGKTDRQRVSGYLTAFATRARKIVQERHGHCIYVGGDDVLAIVPAQQALAVAVALRDAFRQEVGDQAGRLPGVDPAPTFSAGICVAHHLDPIADALDAARAAESDAKQVMGRDALCITVRKRNGAPRSVGMKWAELGVLEELFELLDREGDDGLPRGLPYALREVAARVRPADPNAAGEAQRRLEHSLARGIARQKHIQGRGLQVLGLDTDAADPPADFSLLDLADRVEVARTLAALEGGRA